MDSKAEADARLGLKSASRAARRGLQNLRLVGAARGVSAIRLGSNAAAHFTIAAIEIDEAVRELVREVMDRSPAVESKE
jgi:predicted O-methyltransferase YrrM